MGQLHGASLTVKIVLLLLAQAVEMLAGRALKNRFDPVQVPSYMLVAGHIVALFLGLEQPFSCSSVVVGDIKDGPAISYIYPDFDLPVTQMGFVSIKGCLRFWCRLGW